MFTRTASALALVALCGCPTPDTDTWPDPDTSGDTGVDSDIGTDTDSDTDPDVDTEEPETAHCGTLTQDETWSIEGNPHVVTCELKLEGGDLTIEPGVEVYFLRSTSISVSKDGFQSSLHVLGTEAEPVYFGPASGPGPGKWSGVFISEFAGDTRLENLTINGGGSSITGANLRVDDVQISARNLTLEDSGNVGLILLNSARLAQESSGIVTTTSENFGVSVDCTQAHTLPTENSDYTGNGIDAIFVESGTITSAVMWENLGVPYAIERTINLEGIVPAPAILTIGPGTEIQVGRGGALRVAAAGGAAGLVVNGTETEPVRFTSLLAGVNGHWGGIEAWSATVDDQLIFHHTLIEWAGGNPVNQANLLVIDTPILAENLTIDNGLEYGIRLSGFDGQFRSGSEAIVVTHTALPIQMDSSEAHSLPTDALSSYTGNTLDRIELVGSRQYYDRTWPSIDMPWQLTGLMRIAGPPGQSATLTLHPGTTLMMAWNAAIEVGTVSQEGTGNIDAVGTPTEPIVFTAADSYTWGEWNGIALAACDTGLTQFQHFEVGYAKDAFNFSARDPEAGATCLEPSIGNGFIHHSRNYAFSLALDEWEPDNPMTYSDNLRGIRNE